jgi:anaphase-promoting complex subunit 6
MRSQYAHREEMERCGQALTKEYGLLDDPDVLFGLADELYSAMRYADCYAVTTKYAFHRAIPKSASWLTWIDRILRTHDAHAATLPLHLACMQHLPHLRSKLFLLSHELVDCEPEAVTSWYAVGLWYYSGKRWEEARRYFGKALLLDNRFGPAWIAFAHSFALEGEHDQAITAYSTAQRHFQG